MKKLSQTDIKIEELKILISFAKYCDEHELTYALAYGTLLGAVRHEGFIPWDDDIDIVMPRPDYSALMELVKSGDFPSNLKVVSTELTGYLPAIAKVVNPNIEVDSGRTIEGNRENLWIDIFPMDGIPNNPMGQKLLYLRSKILGTLSIVSTLDWRYKSSFLMRSAAFFFGPIARHSSLETWASKRLRNLCLQIPYDSSDLVGTIAWGLGTCEIVPRSVYDDLIDIVFEGHSFKAPRDYDRVLSQEYGDGYMQLPPESKRVTHELDAFWTNID